MASPRLPNPKGSFYEKGLQDPELGNVGFRPETPPTKILIKQTEPDKKAKKSAEESATAQKVLEKTLGYKGSVTASAGRRRKNKKNKTKKRRVRR